MQNPIPKALTEDFLHFVWRYKNFAINSLRTVDGLPLKILNAGEYNKNAGPDFLNAQVWIDGTHWAGNVEIHIRTSDWEAHRHSTDPAYDNVILHVVYHHDLAEPVPAGRPLLQLSDYIKDDTLHNLETLRGMHQLIPCESLIGNVNSMTRSAWLDRMLAERLETKADAIEHMLIQNRNDWAETAYQWTGRNFGFKINSDPFEMLTRAIPHRMLAKHKNNIEQVEALLYGQAGFLNDKLKDAYPNALKKEYKFLASKYNLVPGRKADWKFLRLRPANFPTIRISQFAALIYRSEHLFSRILELKNIKEALNLFEVTASEYWKHHYQFDTLAESKFQGTLGQESRYNLIINTVAPLLFSYGHLKNEQKYKETAMSLLENCPKELNMITRALAKLDFPNEHAYHSQALIHLKKEYCNRQQCLKCGIGAGVLKSQPVGKTR
jgi:hypothetical protein